MDRKLILITIFLLTLQAALLVTGWPYDQIDHRSGSNEVQKPIGYIVEKRQGVKRRNHNSVVWEDGEPSDTLLSYDNILTLEHSSAELNLNGNIHIDLHENTLVVLEPPSATEPDLVHIRFARGQMVSMSGQRDFGVATDSWQIEARAGSDLSLKSVKGDKVEIEIRSGEIQLKNSANETATVKMSEGTRFTLDKEKISESAKIASDIKFEHPREVHVYTHEPTAKFHAKWVGDAKRIVDSPPGNEKNEFLVDQSLQADLNLSVGTHYLSLANNDGAVSSEIIVDVIPAPRIRYTSPLPRDRFVLNSDVFFSWLPLEGAQRYILEATNTAGDTTSPAESTQNNLNLAPHIEGETFLKVYGIDSSGFKIPPQDTLPIYFIRDPLAAPKLLLPKARAPAAAPATQEKPKAEKETWLNRIWGELWPVAWADENPKGRQIEFNWEAVPGADFYNLEISATADFSDPEIMVKVDAQKFAWSNFKKQIYYWRVAAGVSTGRMGLFSEVAKFDLSKVDSVHDGEIAPGVAVTAKKEKSLPTKPVASAPIVKPEAATPPVAPVAAAPSPLPSPEASAPPPLKKQHPVFDTAIEANLHYRTTSADSNDFSTSLDGFANASASVWFRFQKEERPLYQAQLEYSQVKWQPNNSAKLPFQDSWVDSNYALRFWREPLESEWGLGFLVETIQILKRSQRENLSSSTNWQAGPAFSYHQNITENLYLHCSNGILYGGNAISFATDNFLNFSQEKWWHQPYFGGDLDLKLYFGTGSYSGFDLTSGFHVGVHF